MKNALHAMLLLAGLLLPAAAVADDFYFYPYAGVGFGQFQLATGTNTSKSTVPGGYVMLGAELSPYFAPEIRFGGASKGSTSGYSRVSLDWFISYLGRIMAPISEDTTLYGLAGATTMRTSLTQTAGTKLTDTSTKLSFGVGVDFQVMKNLSVEAEWFRLGRGYKSTSNRGLNATAITGVIKYTF